jgi:hypothetical protein
MARLSHPPRLSGTHSGPYPFDTGAPLPGVKGLRLQASYIVPRSKLVGLYGQSPTNFLGVVLKVVSTGTNLAFFFLTFAVLSEPVAVSVPLNH